LVANERAEMMSIRDSRGLVEGYEKVMGELVQTEGEFRPDLIVLGALTAVAEWAAEMGYIKSATAFYDNAVHNVPVPSIVTEGD
jgi:hypothetical protein